MVCRVTRLLCLQRPVGSPAATADSVGRRLVHAKVAISVEWHWHGQLPYALTHNMSWPANAGHPVCFTTKARRRIHKQAKVAQRTQSSPRSFFQGQRVLCASFAAFALKSLS